MSNSLFSVASRNSAAETKIPRRGAQFSVPRKNEGPGNEAAKHLRSLVVEKLSCDFKRLMFLLGNWGCI